MICKFVIWCAILFNDTEKALTEISCTVTKAAVRTKLLIIPFIIHTKGIGILSDDFQTFFKKLWRIRENRENAGIKRKKEEGEGSGINRRNKK